jgi:hypothetical protein
VCAPDQRRYSIIGAFAFGRRGGGRSRLLERARCVEHEKADRQQARRGFHAKVLGKSALSVARRVKEVPECISGSVASARKEWADVMNGDGEVETRAINQRV